MTLMVLQPTPCAGSCACTDRLVLALQLSALGVVHGGHLASLSLSRELLPRGAGPCLPARPLPGPALLRRRKARLEASHQAIELEYAAKQEAVGRKMRRGDPAHNGNVSERWSWG